MVKSIHKNTREDNAAYAALALVFGAPVLGILTISTDIFCAVVLAVAVFFVVRAWRAKPRLDIKNVV